MRTLAIFGADTKQAGQQISTVWMDGIAVRCAILEVVEPVFDRSSPAHASSVLIRVQAFSLNYRDKSFIFKAALSRHPDSYFAIGSEFVAEVLETGPDVTDLAPGDRVIGNNAYPFSGYDGLQGGIPTNHCSKELLILHRAKLVKIPPEMPDTVAAAFSVGGQTTYGMLRRLELTEPSNVLITAAKSNTSLFCISALRRRNVQIYATSTSSRYEPELKLMGVKELCVINNEVRFQDIPALANVVRERGAFQFAIDPYWDLHFSRVLELMAPGGRYITCGLNDQYFGLIGKPFPAVTRTGREFQTMMLGNLHVIGNCLGTTDDLIRAIQAFQAGEISVTIDSVFTRRQAAEFLDRTFNAKDRFGKVVFKYD